MASHSRPTSPHLSIYRKQITSVLSILHRLTGVALVFGTALLVAWLYVVAYAPGHYDSMRACISSPLGQAVMFGWTVAFYFHLSNGIRHLFWDIGKGFAIVHVQRSGWAVIFFTTFMTLLTWGFIHSAGQ